jgi:hypothetical protein
MTANSPNHIPKKRLPDMNQIELMTARMEAAAVHILENILHRKRWSVSDRDQIADHLRAVLSAEMLHMKPRRLK